jgi:F-type H+-transporting ATPase subunit c
MILFLEAFVVSTRSILTATLALVGLGLVSPVYAQEAAAATAGATVAQWSIITAGFALAFAAGLAALAQGRAVSAAVESIARNPSAAGDVRGNLLLGLVLIESLAIYVLLISLILFFLKPFGG